MFKIIRIYYINKRRIRRAGAQMEPKTETQNKALNARRMQPVGAGE